jgi:adenine C2-methylase RlmN of 23S rRNA A2503 and tRNA A37
MFDKIIKNFFKKNVSFSNNYGLDDHEGPALEITTMVGCPLMCSFCPQGNLKKSYRGIIDKETKYLTIKNFKTILKNADPKSRIDFSGMSEPWTNKECTAMLEHTLKAGFKVAIYSTLFGIKKNDADKIYKLLSIYNSQIDVFCIHLPDKNKNMKGWKYSNDWVYAY